MNRLDIGYGVVGLLTAPWWARKRRGGWAERFGRVPPEAFRAPDAALPRVLIHAVSVGELGAIRELVPKLLGLADVVVSTTTDTGMERAAALYGATCTVVRYPLDFSRSVSRFLDAVRPDAVALVELEVWPNFIAECRGRGIPVCVINGRLSERSFRGYRRIRRWIGRSFASLTTAAVQDSTYASRFEAMGVPPERCVVTDSMKWDSARLDDDAPGAEDIASSLGIERDRPLIVAGSTGPGEEALLHALCPPGVQLLCAPRKPERFEEAARALPGCARRSGQRRPRPAQRRFLLDTIGELRAAYALADVVVVGRSFFEQGGSDPIEPVALGKATIIGPSVTNFTTVVDALVRARGIVQADRARLPSELQRLLRDRDQARAMATRGRDCIRAHRGASERHAQLILGLLPAAATRAEERRPPARALGSPVARRPGRPGRPGTGA